MSDGNDILSQDEIDALLQKNNASDQPELTAEEKDVLGEIGNIAMGSAATALYNILDQKVEITAPEVKVAKFEEITKLYDRPCVLVKVEYIAGLEGVNLLIIKEEDALIIADLMMGGDGNNTDPLDEIRLSAVGEAMNQMMGSSSTSVSSIINDMVNISPPEARYLELDDAIQDGDSYFEPDDYLVDTSFQLKVGNLIDSSFKQLAPLQFTKELVMKLIADNSGGLTAKDNIIHQQEEEVAAALEEDIQQQFARRTAESTRPGETIPQHDAPQPGQIPQQPIREDDLVASQTGKVAREGDAGVKRAYFPDFNTSPAAPLPQNMELIKDVPLQVTVRLGKTRMTIREILDLGEGSIVELDKLAGEPVDLLVNGKLVAKGEVVVIDENFGFRVKDIISPMERLNNI